MLNANIIKNLLILKKLKHQQNATKTVSKNYSQKSAEPIVTHYTITNDLYQQFYNLINKPELKLPTNKRKRHKIHRSIETTN